MRSLLLVRICHKRKYSALLPILWFTAEFHTVALPRFARGVCGHMNIEEAEGPFVEARTCGEKKNKRVAYKFMDAFHSLCLDKKDILLGEINACETLLRGCKDELERKAVEKEISELKMALDLMP